MGILQERISCSAIHWVSAFPSQIIYLVSSRRALNSFSLYCQ
jgi:hypothetical protein